MAHPTPESLETLIRSGRKEQAAAALQKISPKTVPRDQRVHLASLARRVELPHIGILLLAPYVRPRRAYSEPTPRETAEYAACLIRLGAVEEGLSGLAGVSHREAPEVTLYQAFGHIALWDYERALPSLKAYLASQPPRYWQRVAQVNLAACLVATRQLDEAHALLDDLVPTLGAEALTLLQKAAQEIRTRLAVAEKDWASVLKLARNIEQDAAASELHRLFAFKWRFFADAFQHGPTRDTEAQRNELATRSASLGHWETLREGDRVWGKVTQNEGLLAKVYFGTPHPAYRKGLLREWGSQFSLPPTFVREMPSEGSSRRGRRLDLEAGTWNEKNCFKLGQSFHRTSLALNCDFYRPLRLAELHYRIYPDEFYNLVSSPNRVHQAILRWREHARKFKIPLRAIEKEKTYRLENSGPLAIVVPRETENRKLDPFTEKVRRELGHDPFTLRDVEKVLNLSTTSARRWLKSAEAVAGIKKSGQGRATKYRF